MLISLPFINITNNIFSNVTPITKHLNKEREKNNACRHVSCQLLTFFHPYFFTQNETQLPYLK